MLTFSVIIMETIMEQQQEKGSTIIQVNKSKRIILYNPIPKIGEKQIDISLALLSISAKLHEEGFDIHIINHSYKDVTDQILKLSDDCLCMGMGMMTGNQIKDGLAICKNVKERKVFFCHFKRQFLAKIRRKNRHTVFRL